MSRLPLADPITFMGEFDSLDVSELVDLTFLVALSRGARGGIDYMPDTVAGPFTFIEMVEHVANGHTDFVMHMRAFVPAKKLGEKIRVLDVCTIDYIEAQYDRIIADHVLIGQESGIHQFRAGFVDENVEPVADAG